LDHGESTVDAGVAAFGCVSVEEEQDESAGRWRDHQLHGIGWTACGAELEEEGIECCRGYQGGKESSVSIA